MKVLDLGVTDFRDTYKLQQEILEKVSSGARENTLIFTEHDPVITIGRSGSWDNIFKSREELNDKGIDVLKIDRGGDVTYHNIGQLVVYPIVKLLEKSKGIHKFLRMLEENCLEFLNNYSINAYTKKGFRGVWVDDKKIASIGIGIKKWTVYHGMAININNNLNDFSFIRPCGIENVKMTSLKEILEFDVDIKEAKERLSSSFKDKFFKDKK